MPNRKTRSNKNLPLVNLSNQELAELERSTRRAKMLRIVRPDDAGVLRDGDGLAYNDAGQRLDENGQVIEVVVEQPDPPNGVDRHLLVGDDGVARHQQEVEAGNAGVNGVARHHPQGVARHHPADNVENGAAGALVRGMTLGDYNRPEQFYANRCAIRPPPFQRNDFELKPAYYTLVGQHPFHGLSHEHPMDHIEKFEDLVTSIKANGVSYDYLFCKLFPYSLSGDAAYWLKQLRPGSLTTWEDTKNAFLSNFYDDARSEELRTKISAFSQGPTEAFKAAWARFRAYQRDCPHHGFSEIQLLGIFFRGIDWRYQMALDAASNGNFNTNYPENAVVLIENLASSNSTKNADFERKKQAESLDGSHIAEVKAKLGTVHNLLVGKKQVQFAAEVETLEPVAEQEERDVNFVSGSGFQRFGNSQGNRGYNGGSPRGSYSWNQASAKPHYQQPSQNSGSFTRNYGSSSYQSIPPPTKESKMEAMLEQLLEGQQKITVDFNGKLDALYTDLNGKIDTLNIHVKKLDTQVAQTAEAMKRQENTLPGKTNANPRYACNAILLDGDISTEDFDLITEEFLAGFSDEIEDPDFVNPEHVSIDTTEEHRSTPAALVDIKHDLDEECRSTPLTSIDRHPLSVDPEIVPSTKFVKERVYVPIPPYPRSCKDYNVVVARIGLQVPEVHKFRDLPCVKKVINRAYIEEIGLEDAVDLIHLECSAIIHSKLPEKIPDSVDIPNPSLRQLPKVEDPGRFVVPCSIFGVEFKDAMCDSGSTVNLMSKDIAHSLGITELKKSKISIKFADSSTKTPHGCIENLKVKVGDCLLPTDFHIVEMRNGLSVPLILGRSFLATAGALVDLPNKKVCLSNIDKFVFYKAIPENAGIKGSYAASKNPLDKDDIAAGHVRLFDAEQVTHVVASVDRHRLSVSIDTRDEPKNEKAITTPHITLTPQRRVGDSIEYKVKCKGMSKPFSKAKALITPELKAQGQAAIDNALSKVLKLSLRDDKACGPRNTPLLQRERTKPFPDGSNSRTFEPNDQVLLYDARLPLIPGMPLHACWTGPFTVKEVRSHGAVVLLGPESNEFTASGSRVKHYVAHAKTPDGHIVHRDDTPSA